MVSNPEFWVESFSNCGCSLFTFHIETTLDPDGLIQNIKRFGMKVGIAIKPKTEIESVIPFLSFIDQLTVMTVEPVIKLADYLRDLEVRNL